MSNPRNIIPLDIVSGILSELPVKALLRFKSVSKEWFSLINDPYFIKLHLKQSIQTNRHNLHIILSQIGSGKLLSVNFDSVNLDNPRELNHPLKRPHDDDDEDDEDDDDGYIVVLGSCNGLLCLINERCRTIVLWNISTGDYRVLPDVSMELTSAWGNVKHFYGFGHDSINDDYKVVRVSQEEVIGPINRRFISEVIVYSLRTNTWRRGEEIPYYFRNLLRTGTFVCGALHWLALKEITWLSPSSVIAFDVETEKYRQLELLDNMGCKTLGLVLGALRGCLCTIESCLYEDRVNVWMMKDYGVKESWTMLFSLQTRKLYLLRPLAYSKTEDKLLVEKDGQTLLWYLPKDEELKDVDQLKNIKTCFPEICVESLIQLW